MRLTHLDPPTGLEHDRIRLEVFLVFGTPAQILSAIHELNVAYGWDDSDPGSAFAVPANDSCE